MTKKVIDVGQCDLDHGNIGRLLKERFGVEVLRADSCKEAVALASTEKPALILINRLLDADRTPGMAVLALLKEAALSTDIPVMMVSNFEDAQAAAVEAGAVRGFGKSALNERETLTLLAEYLA